MNQRDWASNDEKISISIPVEKRERTEGEIIKVLGVMWNKKYDTLSCQVAQHLPKEGTKRNVLRLVCI